MTGAAEGRGLRVGVLALGAAVGLGLLGLVGWTVLRAMVYPAEIDRAQLSDARDACRRAARLARTYRARFGECPSIGQDLVDRGLAPEPPIDPWGHNLVIECGPDRVAVTSAGPDGSFATDDDVVVASR